MCGWTAFVIFKNKEQLKEKKKSYKGIDCFFGECLV